MDAVSMGKKVMVVISLVEESAEVSNEEIEKEIFKELQKLPLVIPWGYKVLMVKVTDV